MSGVVFLDRDGVINRKRDNDYVKTWDEFEILPKSLEAIALLQAQKYRVVVVSNQAGVGKGLMRPEDLAAIDFQMRKLIRAHGGYVEAAYYCRHRSEDNCGCRKPKPGLFQQAIEEQKLVLKNAWIIGDSERDVQAGALVGCRGILIVPAPVKTCAEHCVANLWDAVQYLLQNK